MALIDLANPTRFLALTARLLPWLIGVTALLMLIGLQQAYMAPDDYQQGATVKIMFVHVPNAWLSMFVWIVMTAAALGTLVWRHPLADVAAKAAAPLGAAFTFVALVTGSLWGRPTWGTYWEWDGRLTSMLVLFFLYLAYIALAAAGAERGSNDRVSAIFGVIGAANIPIIHYSVLWWRTLHQGQSITLSGSTIDGSILWPLPIATLGFTLLFAAVVLMRMRAMLAAAKVEARLKRMAAE